jgi:SAM-dependent methyltransferase
MIFVFDRGSGTGLLYAGDAGWETPYEVVDGVALRSIMITAADSLNPLYSLSYRGTRMQEAKPWYEQNAFWDTVAPVLFTERRWEDAPAEVEQVVSLLKIEPGAHVLDLCCGVGRHSLELARRGFQVTGVDRTRLYLDRASKQAEAERLDIEFVQSDMRTFCRPDAFDAVVNLFTSFGYFEDPEDDRQVAMNVYRSLKPGGAFLIDMMGKEVLARIFRERDWYEENGAIILQERRVTKNWSWMENRWLIFKDNQRAELNLSHRIYSAVELASLLTECGFTHVDAYGNLDGSAYDHLARRLVVVARK